MTGLRSSGGVPSARPEGGSNFNSPEPRGSNGPPNPQQDPVNMASSHDNKNERDSKRETKRKRRANSYGDMDKDLSKQIKPEAAIIKGNSGQNKDDRDKKSKGNTDIDKTESKDFNRFLIKLAKQIPRSPYQSISNYNKYLHSTVLTRLLAKYKRGEFSTAAGESRLDYAGRLERYLLQDGFEPGTLKGYLIKCTIGRLHAEEEKYAKNQALRASLRGLREDNSSD